MDWIDKNQLGRRNLTPDQMSLIRGRMRIRSKCPIGGDRAKQKASTENKHMLKPLGESAKEFGVAKDTLRKDAQFASAVDTLPEVKDKIQNGEKVVKKHVIAAAKAMNESKSTKSGFG